MAYICNAKNQNQKRCQLKDHTLAYLYNHKERKIYGHQQVNIEDNRFQPKLH